MPTVNVRVEKGLVEQLEKLKHPRQSLGGVIEELFQHVQTCDKVKTAYDKLKAGGG